jgi:SAM-dependent methyltransferase
MPRGIQAESDEVEVASLFNRECGRYDAHYDASRGRQLRARFDAVVDVLGPGPGQVVDAGMGPGRLCVELERRGWTASGVDLSEEMVELARTRLPHARDRLVQGSIYRLPFGDEGFDAVTAVGVLEYLHDVPAALRELGRVLAPGGRVVVSIPHAFYVHGIMRRHLWNPAVRAVKRAVPGFSRSAPYRMPPAITVRRLAEALRAAGLQPGPSRHVSYVLLPTLIGGRLGRTERRLAERFEHSRPNAARLFASQVVVLAHKPTNGVDDGKARDDARSASRSRSPAR